MEFIQLGEPLVETNKKFFRFNFYSFTLLHILCELCKERALCTAYRKARSKAVLSRSSSSSSAQQHLEIMLNSASYLKHLSPFLHHLSSASHSFYINKLLVHKHRFFCPFAHPGPFYIEPNTGPLFEPNPPRSLADIAAGSQSSKEEEESRKPHKEQRQALSAQNNENQCQKPMCRPGKKDDVEVIVKGSVDGDSGKPVGSVTMFQVEIFFNLFVRLHLICLPLSYIIVMYNSLKTGRKVEQRILFGTGWGHL